MSEEGTISYPKFQSTRPRGARLLSYNSRNLKDKTCTFCECVFFVPEESYVVKEHTN